MTQSLEARIQRLEDIESIRELKHRYCRLTDWGWNKPALDGVVFRDLFVEDATWEEDFTLQGEWLPEPGRVVRPWRIDPSTLGNVTLETAKGPLCTFGMHHVMNDIIEVDGDDATGQWHMLCPLTLQSPGSVGEAVWAAGMYLETYRRTWTGWKFASIKVVIAFCSPVLKGWVNSPFPAPLSGG